MSALTKRTTVYIEPVIHKALRIKSVETNHSISEIVNESLIQTLREDEMDLAIFKERACEPELAFAAVLKDLKAHGKI
ncbi:MAG: CopG family transcriptional regulator [Gammaproteobacteria bacterium]|nr:CopG family transcriptional regulator [Gammaproteobacteria bacterium]